jgi:hypothetical protein
MVMPIIPSGKRKIMEAQSSMAPEQQWGLGEGFGSAPAEQPQAQPNAQEAAPQQPQKAPGATPAEVPVEAPEQKTEEDGKPDILEYVYAVLEKLGYPPRRLDAFSDEFINEKMFPGGVKEIAVTLPDRYYGQKKRISDGDLSKIMNRIQEQFELTLTDAERKEKKVIMNFTSQQPEVEEEEVPGDDLDEIFGSPKGQEGGKQKSSPKNAPKTLKNPKKKIAKTIHELVKENHNDIWQKLMKVMENK